MGIRLLGFLGFMETIEIDKEPYRRYSLRFYVEFGKRL